MNLPDNHQCSQCLEKFEAIQNMQWEQIKTLSALMERMEHEGGRRQEYYQQAVYEMQQMRVAFIEQYLRKRLQEVEPGDKKGSNNNGLCSERRPEATNT